MRNLRKAPVLDEISVLRAELKLLQDTHATLASRCWELYEVNRELSENLARLATPDTPAPRFRTPRKGISLPEQAAARALALTEPASPVPDLPQAANAVQTFGSTLRRMLATVGARDFATLIDPARNPDQTVSVLLRGDEYIGEDDE